MKLNLEEITNKIRCYSVNDDGLFPVSEKGADFSAGIEIAISRRDKESFVVEGDLKGSGKVPCDRCGDLESSRLQLYPRQKGFTLCRSGKTEYSLKLYLKWYVLYLIGGKNGFTQKAAFTVAH